MKRLGAPLGQLGRRPPSMGDPPRKPRGVKTALPRSPNYLRIKEEVLAEIALLPEDQQAKIPAAATLPEMMIGLALCQLGYQFQAQRPEGGGRLFIGGAIIDFLVYFGAQRLVIRAQGNYWHTMPGRKNKDIVQAERLRARGFRVLDVWEVDCYVKWVEGSFVNWLDDQIKGAA